MKLLQERVSHSMEVKVNVVELTKVKHLTRDTARITVQRFVENTFCGERTFRDRGDFRLHDIELTP